MFDAILSVLLSAVFPEHCRACGLSGTALCSQCQKSLRPSLPINEPKGSFALFDYQHPIVQKAVWELKYHRKSAVAKKLAEYGAPAAKEYVAAAVRNFADSDSMPIVLVPIPQHFTKTYSRGFNQSALICAWLQSALQGEANAVTIQPLLKKVRATEAQAHAHDKRQRQKNLADSMRAAGTIDPHAFYIIVDDVITTGSTIAEARRALGAAGAVCVHAIALAHGYASKRR